MGITLDSFTEFCSENIKAFNLCCLDSTKTQVKERKNELLRENLIQRRPKHKKYYLPI